MKHKVMQKEKLLPLFGLSFFLIAFGLMVDGWWHIAIGRDSFFIPPHLFMYAGINGNLALSGYLFWKNRKEKYVRGILISMIVMILTGGIFDNIWHAIFGSERMNEVWLVLSPPHVVMIFSVIIGGFFALLFIDAHSKYLSADIKQATDIAIFSSILAFVYLFTSPFFPLGGWSITGNWGELFSTFGVVLLLVFFKQKQRPFGTTLAVAGIYLLLLRASGVFVEKSGHGIIPPDWLVPPFWITISSVIAPLFLIEVLTYKKVISVKYGFLYGLLFSSILYLGAKFLAPWGKVFSFQDIAIIVLGASTGGFLAGLAGKRFKLYRKYA